jgi:hypothetical protein
MVCHNRFLTIKSDFIRLDVIAGDVRSQRDFPGLGYQMFVFEGCRDKELAIIFPLSALPTSSGPSPAYFIFIGIFCMFCLGVN